MHSRITIVITTITIVIIIIPIIYDDGDHNVYRHNDLGGKGQHNDGQRSHLDQKRELYGKSGGGEHQLLSSAVNITKQSAKAVWDSPIIRAVTPDAITFGVETNGYVFGGGSSDIEDPSVPTGLVSSNIAWKKEASKVIKKYNKLHKRNESKVPSGHTNAFNDNKYIHTYLDNK